MYEFYPFWKRSFTGMMVLGVLIILVTVLMVTYRSDMNPLSPEHTHLIGGIAASTLFAVTALKALGRYIVRRSIIHEQDIILRDGHTTHIAFRYGRGLSGKLLKFWDVMPKEGEIRPVLVESEKVLSTPAPRVSINDMDPYVFVTFKKQGTLKGWDERARVLLWLTGIRRWQWCEVEWFADDNENTHGTAMRQLQHEFEHTMIARSYPQWDGAMQHRVMDFSRRDILPDLPFA